MKNRHYILSTRIAGWDWYYNTPRVGWATAVPKVEASVIELNFNFQYKPIEELDLVYC